MSEKVVVEGYLPSKEILNTSSEDEEHVDHAVEKKLLRRIDWHLIPILFLLFLCAFIDR